LLPVMKVGLISDTHGLLRAEALQALAGSDFIIHAGDIGDQAVLERLGEIAPVTAVRGNNDTDAWAAQIPETNVLDAKGIRFFVLHSVNDLDVDPAEAGFQAVVSGHSHRPEIHVREGVLFINPGSAGPRRFRLPISVATVVCRNGQIAPQLVELTPSVST
jgi:putative phosphoesterase